MAAGVFTVTISWRWQGQKLQALNNSCNDKQGQIHVTQFVLKRVGKPERLLSKTRGRAESSFNFSHQQHLDFKESRITKSVKSRQESMLEDLSDISLVWDFSVTSSRSTLKATVLIRHGSCVFCQCKCCTHKMICSEEIQLDNTREKQQTTNIWTSCQFHFSFTFSSYYLNYTKPVRSQIPKVSFPSRPKAPSYVSCHRDESWNRSSQ